VRNIQSSGTGFLIGAAAAGACLLACGVMVITGCANAPFKVLGGPGVSSRPEIPWTPPPSAAAGRSAFEGAAEKNARPPGIPKEYLARLDSLSLSDIVNIALLNSSQTRQAWAQARAAAALYGSQQGAFFPQINASLSANQQQNSVAGGKLAYTERNVLADASFSWLILDWGGRISSVNETKYALFAADWTHDAAIQNVILQVEQAYYGYFSAKSLHAAQQASVDEAATNLKAADERDKAGLGTTADVLQARTALSQAKLSFESLAAQIMTTRGVLATAMGLPANTGFDVNVPVGAPPLDSARISIGEFLDSAMRLRPDLAAAAAQARQAEAHAYTVLTQLFPSFSASGDVGRIYFSQQDKGSTTYNATVSLDIPLFFGFSRLHNLIAARAQADAARAGEKNFRDLVVLQVWTDYYNLESSGQMVRTSDDLLASAQQNHDVAAGRYGSGVGTIIDLLTAQAALEGARAQQVQARAGWWTAAAQLAHDTGMLTAVAAVKGRGVQTTGE